MTAKVVALQIKPGIQRDGTTFNAPSYMDGQWCRFQNGLPRKMGGYRGIFLNASGISRGMTMSSTNGLNYVISGTNNNLQQWSTDNDDGVGSGPVTFTIAGGVSTFTITNTGSAYVNGTYTSVALTGGTGINALATIVIAGTSVSSVTITTAGSGYLTGDVLKFSDTLNQYKINLWGTNSYGFGIAGGILMYSSQANHAFYNSGNNVNKF